MNSDTPILRHSDTSSFTLIELLVVMCVIAVLVGITLPVAKYVSWRINYEREKVMLNEIHDALDQYRLLFGEYPVPGSERHYPTDYFVDPSNYLPDEYKYVNLCATTNIETLDFSTTYKVDYSLTWPLMLGPESRGERPYMTFPEATVTYLVYDTPGVSTQKITRKLLGGGEKTKTYFYLLGKPINRRLAIAPTSGKQWKYECSDGVVYTLSTNGVQ